MVDGIGRPPQPLWFGENDDAKPAAGPAPKMGGVFSYYYSTEDPEDRRGFRVEVVEHFDVVGDEADGAEHRGIDSAGRFRAEVIEDVRLQPGILGTAAAALVNERGVTVADNRVQRA